MIYQSFFEMNEKKLRGNKDRIINILSGTLRSKNLSKLTRLNSVDLTKE